MGTIELLKEKLRIVTSNDLRRYIEDTMFPQIYKDRRLYNKGLRRRERRILERVFVRIRRDTPFVESLFALFDFSPVFQEIVLNSLKDVIGKFDAHVDKVLVHAPRLILFHSRQRKEDIFSSIPDSTGMLDFTIDLPVRYGKENHTTRDEWRKFLKMLQ